MDLGSGSFSVAVVGAGPVGLALALLLAQRLPNVRVTTYDARHVDDALDVDSRVLALSLGSVDLLRRLKAVPDGCVQPITGVFVSQQQPSLLPGARVRISAQEMRVPMLGMVAAYSDVVRVLQERWLACVQNDSARLHACFGHRVSDVRLLPEGGVQVDAKVLDRYDLAVVAEGGVFAGVGDEVNRGDQKRQSAKAGWMQGRIQKDYGQDAWVGRVMLEKSLEGVAFECFSSGGPVALLPLKGCEAALVWCQPRCSEDIAQLGQAQRLAVLNTLFPQEVGRVTAVSDLKCFKLGLYARRSLVHGCMVYMGNAAQMLHPVAGQGLNLGFRDAYMLAQQLARQTGQGKQGKGYRRVQSVGEMEGVLRGFDFARGADRWGMMGMTGLLGQGFTWDLPLLPELRNVALRTLQNVGPVKHFLARRMMFGWR